MVSYLTAPGHAEDTTHLATESINFVPSCSHIGCPLAGIYSHHVLSDLAGIDSFCQWHLMTLVISLFLSSTVFHTVAQGKLFSSNIAHHTALQSGCTCVCVWVEFLNPLCAAL